MRYARSPFGRVLFIEDLGRLLQVAEGFGEDVHFALAGKEGCNLLHQQRAPRKQGHRGKFGLGRARRGLARNGDGLYAVHFGSGGLLGLAHNAQYTGYDCQDCGGAGHLLHVRVP
jgi:hypothetical protein